MEEKVTTAAIKGLIISLIMIVFSLVTIYAEQTENKALGFVPIAVLLAGVIWGCIVFARQKDHNVTFGNVFAHGFKTTAAVIALMAVYMLLLFLVIKPELKDLALEQSRQALEKQNMSEADIQNALDVTNKIFLPAAIGGAMVTYALIGCIASLIGAGVAKKNPNPTPF